MILYHLISALGVSLEVEIPVAVGACRDASAFAKLTLGQVVACTLASARELLTQPRCQVLLQAHLALPASLTCEASGANSLLVIIETCSTSTPQTDAEQQPRDQGPPCLA